MLSSALPNMRINTLWPILFSVRTSGSNTGKCGRRLKVNFVLKFYDTTLFPKRSEDIYAGAETGLRSRQYSNCSTICDSGWSLATFFTTRQPPLRPTLGNRFRGWFRGDKAAEHEDDRSLPSGPKFKNAWSCTSRRGGQAQE